MTPPEFQKKLLATCFLGITISLSACIGTNGDESDKMITATVSIPPQEWILHRICGDRVQINCLLEAGADPENYEPSMRQLRELTQSDVYFTLGGLPFEQALIQRVSDNMPNLKIVDTTPGIKLLTDHCHGDSDDDHHEYEHEHKHEHGHHETFDPHIWTSLRNCQVMAANMTRQLSTIDSANADVYTFGLVRLDSILSEADDSIQSILAPCRNRTFMAWHPSLGYFAEDYNLHQLSVQQQEKEVTPRQLADAINVAHQEHPTVVFYEISQQGSETALLSDDLNTPAVPLSLMQQSFVNELIKAAKAIRSHQPH